MGVTSPKLFRATCREAGPGVQLGTIFGEGPPPKIWEGKKTSKIQRDFRQLSTLIANISGMDPHIENRKFLINYNHSHVGRKKVGELWSTNKKVIGAHVDAPKWNIARDYISTRRGCWPLKFLHALQIDQGLLAHTPGGLTLGSAPYF